MNLTKNHKVHKCISFTALQQYVNQYGKQPDSIVSTVANQAFQKHFFPYVLLQLLLLSRWVTRSLRVQLNLCGGPSPPHKFFPDPQNLQDWRTANFFQMSPLLYDGINERYCFLLRVLLPLILFPLVSIRLTKQWHFVAAKSEHNYSDCEQRRGVWGIMILMITSWFGKEGYIREGCSNLHLQIKLCLFPLKRKTMLIFCAALNCISKTGRFVILSSLQPN